jgi:hypothetical protein
LISLTADIAINMFTGKFTATFIGNAASAQLSSNKSGCFGITELNKIKCTESRRIIESEMNQILQGHQTMRVSSIIQGESVAFHVPGGIERHQIDWESFRFYNPVFSAIHHTNRGFNFPYLKNITLLDALLSLIVSIPILRNILRWMFPQLPHYSSEIYVGYLEADFVCRVAP